MKGKTLFIAACVIMIILAFSLSYAALYQWVDQKGHLHITDYPPPRPHGAEKAEKEEDIAAERPAEMMEPVPGAPIIDQPPAELHMKKAEKVQPQPVPSVQPPKSQQPTDVQVTKPVIPSPAPAPPNQPAPQSGKVVIPFTGQGKTPVMPPIQMPGGFPSGFDPKMLEKGPSPQMIQALVAGFGTVLMVLGIGLYIFTALCMYRIAKKTDVPAAWLAWIPILQIWTFFASAGKSLLWIIPCLIPFVNVIVGVYLWMCIAENVGKNKWLGLLTLLPVLNLVLMAVLAFSKKESAGSPSPAMA